MATINQNLTNQLGVKLRQELIRPKGQDEHDDILRDATAYNMAVSANDEDTIKVLARKYGVKASPKTGDQPVDDKPKPLTPKPKSVKDSGDQPVDDDLAAWRKEVDGRLDGHDRRHEQAEGNLKALNGAVGVTQNPEGAWVPIPDGTFYRVGKTTEYLGYNRDKDGTVTFTDLNRPVSTDNTPAPRWWILLIGTLVGVVLFFAFFAVGGGATYALVALAIGIGLGLTVFLVDLMLRKADNPAVTTNDNHPSR